MLLYRQKILIALLQVFGGSLKNTDLEKLLFLYSHFSHSDHYNFFPYKYGAYSFTSYYDKRKLTEKGVLCNSDEFKLCTNKAYILELDTEDRISLKEFAKHIGTLRGRELVRRTYLDYPKFAISSEILHEILTPHEYSLLSGDWIRETQPVLFTIGYEGISIDEYLFRLITNNVVLLVDVRKNPVSRKHGFSKNQLSSYAEKCTIIYQHLPDLGIDSHLRKSLDSDEAYENLFEHYASEILPNQQEALSMLKDLIQTHGRVALTCFEANFNMCHRHKIADMLNQEDNLNIPIVHL